jgi:hypothetical protein
MALTQEYNMDLVAFSHSDIPHVEVMHKASIAMAGALISPLSAASLESH